MINDLLASLELVKNTFRSLIVTSNYEKISGDIISWRNYTSGIFKNLYAKEFELLIRKRQYSFLLAKDKGFIQFYYQFEGGNLRKAKLSYYPYPILLADDSPHIESYIDDSDDKIISEYYFDLWNLLNHHFELKINDDRLVQLLKDANAIGNTESAESILLGKIQTKYKITNSSHLRVDYDSKVETHHKCEMQFGGVNHIRLPITSIIDPLLFSDFIFKHTFPEDYLTISQKHNYPSSFAQAKRKSLLIKPFEEKNIFITHL